MSNDKPSYEELIKILTDEKLRPLKIITIALCAGVILFFFVTFFFYYNSSVEDVQQSDVNILDILFPVMIIITITMYTVVTLFGNQILKIILRNSNLSARDLVNSEYSSLLSVITSYTIVRLAMMESAAFFGLIVLMMSILSGVLAYYPVYWAGVIPMIIMLIYAARIFPSRENAALLVEEKIYPLIK